jgi:hypothetical protein
MTGGLVAHQSPDGERALGPVDYVAVEFPDGTVKPGGLELLLQHVERGVIRILDLEFLRKGADGVQQVAVGQLPAAASLDLSVWEGSSSGLLDADDLELIGAEMADGAVAAVVVFENLWVLDVVDRWADHGARLIFDGSVPVADLLTALDATDTN